MARENSVIETGVDKLVELVKATSRISVPDAAKKSGVGVSVVEEWADFLEEEGIISMEYKFATPYLVEKKLSAAEVKEKEKEFHGKKEGFIRKAEVTLAILDKEGDEFQKFKNSFEKIKKDLGSELEHVENEFKELERFENLKKNIDKQILEQEKEFQNKMNSFEAEIKREQQKYQDILVSITHEEEKLDRERLDTISMREKEMDMRKKISQFQSEIVKLNESVKNDESMIDDSSEKLKYLKSLAETIKKEISQKFAQGKSLMDESAIHKKKIMDIQNEILLKVAKNSAQLMKDVESGKASTEKSKEFFKKKNEIEELIKEMDTQKMQMESELVELIKKAKAFHLSTNSQGLKAHVKELESTFDDVKKKKDLFERAAAKLSSLLR